MDILLNVILGEWLVENSAASFTILQEVRNKLGHYFSDNIVNRLAEPENAEERCLRAGERKVLKY